MKAESELSSSCGIVVCRLARAHFHRARREENASTRVHVSQSCGLERMQSRLVGWAGLVNVVSADSQGCRQRVATIAVDRKSVWTHVLPSHAKWHSRELTCTPDK